MRTDDRRLLLLLAGIVLAIGLALSFVALNSSPAVAPGSPAAHVETDGGGLPA